MTRPTVTLELDLAQVSRIDAKHPWELTSTDGMTIYVVRQGHWEPPVTVFLVESYTDIKIEVAAGDPYFVPLSKQEA